MRLLIATVAVAVSACLFGVPGASAEDPVRVFSGVWHDQRGFGESTCFGLLALAPGGTFYMNQCDHDVCTVTALEGTWQVEARTLILHVKRTLVFKGEVDEWHCAFDKEPTSIDSEARLLKLPRGPVMEESPRMAEGLFRWTFVLAETQYWKVEDGLEAVETYCQLLFSCRAADRPR
jgi:hypothetical protein